MQVKCGWAGLSSVGCGGKSCTTYIKGTVATDITILFHELGHTQGLSHSGFGRDEYGDRSDVMGDDGVASIGYLCTNAPNMFRIGWAGPAFHLRPLEINNAPSYTIPVTSASDANYIALNLTVPGIPMPTYFISARARTTAYDSILQAEYSNRVRGVDTRVVVRAHRMHTRTEGKPTRAGFLAVCSRCNVTWGRGLGAKHGLLGTDGIHRPPGRCECGALRTAAAAAACKVNGR